MGQDDKPRRKKSWREIDRGKDKSAHRDHESKEQRKDQASLEHSTAYHNYKSDLEKVFSGGDVPDYLKQQLPKGGENEGRLKLIGAIQRSTDDSELADAMKKYLKKYDDFPEDFSLMLRVLDYPDESVQLTILRQLDNMERVRPVEHKQQFILKIDGIAMMGEDDDLLELAEELVQRLRG